jgi:beta-mannosidase
MISENIEKLLKGEKKNDVVVHAAFTTKKGKTYDNNYVMLKQKDINYPHVDIDYSFAPAADGYDITLKAPKFARAVFIEIDDINSVLSDNYFDMLPGETRTIRVNTNLTPDKLKETLNVQSLAD